MGQVVECCVYIIKSTVGTYYTGITINLINRWQQHKDGRSSYFSHFKPLEVVYVGFYGSKREAARVERSVKKVGARKYLLKLKYRL